MEIEFAFDDSSSKNLPIEDLVYKYLYNLKVQGSQTNSSGNNTLLNSILISLQSNKNTLEIVYKTITLVIEQQTDVASIKNLQNRAATLIQHIVLKSPKIISKTNVQILILILEFSISKVTNGSSGNQYITIIHCLLFSLHKMLKQDQQKWNNIKQQILKIFANPKFHPVSYTQLIRNKLYDLLLLAFPRETDSTFIITILNSTNSQKDPRNISKVFELYLAILKNTSIEILSPFKETLFENLQAYYPIDFVGDQEQERQMKQKNIDLQKISELLDQCLTSQIFRTQLDQLLITKFSAPPCRKFIRTLQKFMRINDSKQIWERQIKKWMVIVVRLLQEEHLQEQLSGTQYISRTLLAILQYRIKFENQCYSAKFHKIIETLCYKSFHQLYNIQTWKHASTVLNIYKSLLAFQNSKTSSITSFLNVYIMKYLIKLFIQHSSTLAKASTELQKDHLVICLGSLLICQYTHFNTLDIEQAGLLLIGLKQIFAKFSQQPNICLIILKIVMKIWEHGKKIISIKNLIQKAHSSVFHKTIELRIQASSQQIIQSYMDYLIQLQPDSKTVQLILTLSNDECKLYSTVCAISSQSISQDNQAILCRQLFKVIQQINWDIDTKVLGLVKHLICNWKLEKIINFCKSTQKQQFTDTAPFLQILTGCFYRAYQKTNNLLEDEDQSMAGCSITFINFLKQSKQSLPLWQIYCLRRIWRLQINCNQIRSNVKAYLCLKDQTNFQESLIAYYNNAVILKNISSSQIIGNIETNSTSKYPYLLNKNIKNVQPFNSHCISLYEPTFLHFLWKNNLIDDLNILGHLPQIILKDNSKTILEKVLTSQQTIVLNKIVPYIAHQQLITKVLPYCLNYYKIKENKQIEVLDIVSMHSIVNLLVKKVANKEENYVQIRDHLQKNAQQLRQVIEKALQHRKRLARQSARMLINNLDSLSIR